MAIVIDKRELFWSDFNFVNLNLGDKAKVFRPDLKSPPQTDWQKYLARRTAEMPLGKDEDKIVEVRKPGQDYDMQNA